MVMMSQRRFKANSNLLVTLFTAKSRVAHKSECFSHTCFFPIRYLSHRFIEADIFLTHFSSDRMHMWNEETKTWNSPPPSYQCIVGKNTTLTSNLEMYINMVKVPREKVNEEQSSQDPSGDNGKTVAIGSTGTDLSDDDIYGVVYTLQELSEIF